MRIFSILTALLVTGLLYLFVVERDLLRGLIGFSSTEEENLQLEEPTEDPEQLVMEEIKPVNVVASTFEQEMVDTSITLTGTTRAARYVDVKSETSGLVISEPFRKGENVSKGDILCELDPGTRLAVLDEAQAQLKSAEINAVTATRLADGGLGSEASKTSAQATLQATLAAIDRAEKEISRLTIKAPFDGLLETDAAEVGSLLQTGSLCATIIQLDPIRIIGFVSESDVDKLQIGNPAQARLISGRNVTGEVTFISRSADESTRTFKVEITVGNSDLSIRDGLTAEISILA
ncbi:MAG: efflux RND transporter periplasmic adaptor subunit, partial [Rhodobacteraceae bacterium]|nr:efflux RND transporter periplasmic adaptor subunit [Paracoccaceae bacterium]